MSLRPGGRPCFSVVCSQKTDSARNRVRHLQPFAMVQIRQCPTGSFTQFAMLRTCIIAFLIALVAILCMRYRSMPTAIEQQQPVTSVSELDSWRRTNAGWEQTTNWQVSATPEVSANPPFATRLHPLIVAALVMLFSLAALVAQLRPLFHSCLPVVHRS